MTATDQISALIAGELHTPVGPAAAAMAEHCCKRHEKAALAVLFYGSCLRQPDQALTDALLDFYVLVDDYRAAYASPLMAWANEVLPPNVFYVEMPWQGAVLRAKYAVMSLRQFRSACLPDARNVSIWARFSQPARLIWCRDSGTDQAVQEALVLACKTMFGNARVLMADVEDPDPVSIWQTGFAATYAAELRSEKSERGLAIVAADEARYRELGRLLLAELRPSTRTRAEAQRDWQARGRLGKRLNLFRLIKAAFTFDGAVDYVLWKVRRHSGVVIEVSDWQRRHPLLAAPWLTWKLYRRGAFR